MFKAQTLGQLCCLQMLHPDIKNREIITEQLLEFHQREEIRWDIAASDEFYVLKWNYPLLWNSL